MRTLTNPEIEKLASQTGVRRIAVENFLSSMGNDSSQARANLRLDGRSYGWNVETRKAIETGIQLAEKAPLNGADYYVYFVLPGGNLSDLINAFDYQTQAEEWCKKEARLWAALRVERTFVIYFRGMKVNQITGDVKC
jgi:hypothetical protein